MSFLEETDLETLQDHSLFGSEDSPSLGFFDPGNDHPAMTEEFDFELLPPEQEGVPVANLPPQHPHAGRNPFVSQPPNVVKHVLPHQPRIAQPQPPHSLPHQYQVHAYSQFPHFQQFPHQVQHGQIPQTTMSPQPMEFSPSPFSPPPTAPSVHPPLRPLAPQVGVQYLPPTPPPPPPKGHLTSASNAAIQMGNRVLFPRSLAPSLSDSETRHLTEDDFAGGELRMIAPKPPSLPPADYHRRATQKPPHDSISSPVSKRTRTRAKRRSTSKMEREQKERFQLQKARFLTGCELNDQLAILREKFAASEAESRALKERLTATESELAELRLKVQRYDSMNTPSPLSISSPGSDMMTTPSPTILSSPDTH